MFAGTVFAYGQTSSGKTFTMRGTQDTPGIIPLAIRDVFKNLEQVFCNINCLLKFEFGLEKSTCS